MAFVPSAEEPCTCAEEPEYLLVLRSRNTLAFVPVLKSLVLVLRSRNTLKSALRLCCRAYTCAEEPEYRALRLC